MRIHHYMVIMAIWYPKFLIQNMATWPHGHMATWPWAMMPTTTRWSISPSIYTRPGKRSHNELENHHVSWENQLFQWSFSIAILT